MPATANLYVCILNTITSNDRNGLAVYSAPINSVEHVYFCYSASMIIFTDASLVNIFVLQLASRGQQHEIWMYKRDERKM